jgi:ArsR family transcriptional regulator
MSPQIESMEMLFQALGDATRLRILGLLLAGEVCVCDIHDTLKISQPKASRHLAYLRRAGLVEARREGLWMYYRLAQTRDPLVETVRQAVAHTLGHIDVIRKDADRLEKRTGCCMPQVLGAPSLACCGPVAMKKATR